jgi:hypothetical protein
VRNTWIFFGSCAGQPNFDAVVNNALGILRGARETIIQQGHVDATTLDRTLAHFATWGKRPDAALWFSICWAEGVKLGSSPLPSAVNEWTTNQSLPSSRALRLN